MQESPLHCQPQPETETAEPLLPWVARMPAAAGERREEKGEMYYWL